MGIVKQLAEINEPKRILTIDSSTNSFAWSRWDNKNPVDCGELFFEGDTAIERVSNCAIVLDRAIRRDDRFNVDLIVVESTVGVKSQASAIKLAYIVGAVVGAFATYNISAKDVPPITWQCGIGNKLLTKAEKDQIKKDFPDKSASWYSDKGRNIRKQRTKDIVSEYFDVNKLTSFDISDSCGLGLYWSKR